MDLPLLLPAEFIHYQEAPNELLLLEQLREHSVDLIRFFEAACADQTWSEMHPTFMTEAMAWLTAQFLEGRLSIESAEAVTRVFQKHYSVLRSYLPRDIVLRVQGQDLSINSMMLAVSSAYFRERIRIECYEQRQKILVLKDQGNPILHPQYIEEFVHTGSVADLWKEGQEDLLRFLRNAVQLDMPKLVALCQETLKRYINGNNAKDLLLTAHTESWPLLKQSCMQFLNKQSLGVKFIQPREHPIIDLKDEVKPFALEFQEFNATSWDVFSYVNRVITHLSCSGLLTQEQTFSQAVEACLQLFALDISRSHTFSERLLDLPSSLLELDLSSCPWLTNENLKRMIAICPNLQSLILDSSSQITYLGWGELQRLPLRALDISRCSQMTDEDFSILIRACGGLVELSLEACKRLTDRSFAEIARHLPQLAALDLGRTGISDGLLVEIVARCRHLQFLDISRCTEITDQGLLRALRQGQELRQLVVGHCPFMAHTLAALQKLNPHLQIIS